MLASWACSSGPQPAPDRDIVYTSSSEGQREQLWRMGPDGSNARPILPAAEGVTETFPVWSPDGTSIAFMSSRNQSGRIVISLIDADGGNLRQIGPDSIPLQAAPDFSPDGEQVVFSGGSWASGIPQSELYIMAVDGTNLRQLTRLGGFVSCPRWSPDGEKILFARDINWLGVVDVESGEVSTVLPSGIDGTCGDWSPDGTQLAFASGPDGQVPSIEEFEPTLSAPMEIFTLDLASEALTHHPRAGSQSNYPRWSRDGRRLVFQCALPPGEIRDSTFVPSPEGAEICLMAADGSDVRQITDNLVLDVHPNW